MHTHFTTLVSLSNKFKNTSYSLFYGNLSQGFFYNYFHVFKQIYVPIVESDYRTLHVRKTDLYNASTVR